MPNQKDESNKWSKEKLNPNHIAGSSEIEENEALESSVGKVLDAIEFPDVLAIADAFVDKPKNFPKSLEELFDKAGIDFNKTAENFLNFVGIPVSILEATGHFLICGTTGSGKTTLIKCLMPQAIQYVGENRNQRAIIYDPKNEIVSFLSAVFSNSNEIVKILNPFDARCVRWNLAKDIRTKSEAKTFASIVIPDDSNNPFFPKSARLILADVIYSFIRYAEDIREKNKIKSKAEQIPVPEWTLRDVCCAFHAVFIQSFEDEIKQVKDLSETSIFESNLAEIILQRYPLTRRTLKFIKRGEGQNSNNDVLLTLLAYIDDLEAIAAAWDNREEEISLRDWAVDKKGQILVLGRSAQNEEALNAINSAMIQFVRAIIIDGEEAEQDIDIKPIDKDRTYTDLPSIEEMQLQKWQPENKEAIEYPPRTWLFLDEFASLKIKNLDTFLTEGRSKGVCVILSFQNYASIQENYKKYIASVITSCCNFKIFLRSEGEAADWIAQEIGKERRFETSYGTNESTSEAESRGTTDQTGGQSSSGSGAGGYHSNSGTSWSNARTVTYTTTTTTGTSTTVSVVERDIVMKGDITSLKPASKTNGLEGFVQFSGVAGKIWKFQYNWAYVSRYVELEKRILEKYQKSQELKRQNQPYEEVTSLEPRFINRFDQEGLDFLELRPFDETDFSRLGLDYTKYLEKAKQKIFEQEFHQIKVSFEQLQVFINKLILQDGRKDPAMDESFYNKLSEFDKKTVDNNVNKKEQNNEIDSVMFTKD